MQAGGGASAPSRSLVIVGAGRSLYDVLGVAPTAAPSEIRAAYKSQALRSHPDKGGSAEAFRAVIYAFETLSSSQHREAYDCQLVKHASKKRRQHPAGAAVARVAFANDPTIRKAFSETHRQRQYQQSEPARIEVKGIHQKEPKHAPGQSATESTFPADKPKTKSPQRKRSLAFVYVRRLSRLHRLLVACSLGERQQTLEKMSINLRAKLAEYMENRMSGNVFHGVNYETDIKPPMRRKSHQTTASSTSDRSGHQSSLRVIASPDCSSESTDESRSEATSLAIEDVEFSESLDSIDNHSGIRAAPLALTQGLEGSQCESLFDSGDVLARDAAGGGESEVAGSVPNVESGTSRPRRLKHGGVNEVRAKGYYVYYDARITFRNLTLATSLTRSLEVAINAHTTIVTIRQRAFELEAGQDDVCLPPDLAGAERFEACIRQALAEADHLEEFGLTFQVVIDARQWVGKMVSSPRMLKIEEALQVWRQVEDARQMLGWRGLRRLWLEWMQKPRRARWGIRTRSAEEAEEIISMAEHGYNSTRERLEKNRIARDEKQQATAARRQRYLQVRAERHAKRKEREDHRRLQVVLLAESVVQAMMMREKRNEYARKQKEENQRKLDVARSRQAAALRRQQLADRTSKQQRKERLRWMQRRDLTMDDILSGYPGARKA